MSNKEWLWMDDLNEEGYPLKKIKRIKNEWCEHRLKFRNVSQLFLRALTADITDLAISYEKLLKFKFETGAWVHTV